MGEGHLAILATLVHRFRDEVKVSAKLERKRAPMHKLIQIYLPAEKFME
jgi:hypothetical protein